MRVGADEWQWFVLEGALGEHADGSWSAPTVGLTVARQNGKDYTLELRELYGLFVLGESINHTAHQQKTATNHFERLLRLIEGCPDFERRVLRAPRGKGLEAIHLRGGNVIYFATRAGGGGRGLTFDLNVYNEAMFLSEQDRSSLAPTMAARSMEGMIQTWYVGSAVDRLDPAQDGVPFAQVRERGIAGAPGVAYFEWSVPGDDPGKVPPEVAADPEMWALANPALGRRISHDWVERERTTEMSARSFAVERLSIGAWPLAQDAAAPVIDPGVWAAALDLGSVPLDPVCLAFDVSPDREWACVAAAGRRADGLLHVEVTADGRVSDYRRGTGWLVARLVALAERHEPVAIVAGKGSPAATLTRACADAGLAVTWATSVEEGQAFGAFVDAVGQGALKHLGTPVLAAALGGAVKQASGDASRWSRRSSGVDITPLTAATLAVWGLGEDELEPLVAS